MRKGIYLALVFALAITLVFTVMAQNPGRGNGSGVGQQGAMNCQGTGMQMRHGGMHGQGADMSAGRCNGQGSCLCDGQGFDPSSLVQVSGTVAKVNIAQGQGFPNVELNPANGKTLTVVVGPYWLLEQEKFELKEGDVLMVSGFLSKTKADTLVAAQITRNNQEHIVLRDEIGRPVGSGGGTTCPHDGTCQRGETCPNPSCPRK